MKNSSVSIPTYLRKRIKQLAAEKDTSQAKLIEEAIELLEKNMKNDSNEYWTDEEKEYLHVVSEEVYNNDLKRKQRVKNLSEPGPDIEEAIIRTWTSDIP